jgi:hypothetical protein
MIQKMGSLKDSSRRCPSSAAQLPEDVNLDDRELVKIEAMISVDDARRARGMPGFPGMGGMPGMGMLTRSRSPRRTRRRQRASASATHARRAGAEP